MTTVSVDSLLIGKALAIGSNQKGYSRKKILLPNIPTPAAGNGVSSVTVSNAGSGYATVPTVSFTGGGGSGATAIAQMLVQTNNIYNAGTNYAPNDTITLAGGTFSSAAVLTVTNTQLVSALVGNNGSGYAVGETLTCDANGGGIATTEVILTISSVDGGGGITGFTITNPGVFTKNAVGSLLITDQSGAGSGATIVSPVFGVNTASVTSGGAYTAVPVNPVGQSSTSGTGTGASFFLSYGVGSILVTNSGDGYTSAPTVSITGDGSGTIATAVTGGANVPVTINLDFVPDLATNNYIVKALANQPAVISYVNKTTDSVSITLAPPSGGTLVSGTMDVLIEFTY